MLSKQKVLAIVCSLLVVFILQGNAMATIYFSETSESRTCNAAVPWYWEITQGFFKCDGDAYSGSKYLDWHVVNHGISAYTGIDISQAGISGKTIYMALFFKIKRVNGVNVFHNSADQSYDKFFEFDGSGVRWIYKIGKHESGCYPALNGANSFTMWIGTQNQYNPGIECIDGYVQNANGYSGNNPYQISYDTWHSAVMEIKIATNNTGIIRGYIDGVKTTEYTNVITATGGPTISAIKLNGTVAQPAYDAPEHYRRMDNIIVTDNLQDIIDGGYLSGQSTTTRSNPPVLNP